MQIKGYNTKQKNMIIEMLENNKERHLTADEMLKILENMNHPVSKATLYRFLDVLVSTNNLKKFVSVDGEKACYQYVGDDDVCHTHYHLKCVECGKLIHIECHHIDEIKEHVLKKHNFNVDPQKIILYGGCKECMEAHHEKNN